MALTDAERMRNMRRRRRESIEADPDAQLRDADELIAPALAETLASLDLQPEDVGVAKLAERYARIIDQAKDPAYALRWIGPLLADALNSLGATPAARAALGKAKPAAPSGPSPLDQLRARRVSGKRPDFL